MELPGHGGTSVLDGLINWFGHDECRRAKIVGNLTDVNVKCADQFLRCGELWVLDERESREVIELKANNVNWTRNHIAVVGARIHGRHLNMGNGVPVKIRSETGDDLHESLLTGACHKHITVIWRETVVAHIFVRE